MLGRLLMVGGGMAVILGASLLLTGGEHHLGTFEVLILRVGLEQTDFSVRLLYLLLGGLIFMAGEIAALLGVLISHPRQGATSWGRILLALGGSATFVTAALLLWATLGMRNSFYVMGTTDAAPKSVDVVEMIDSANRVVPPAYGLLVVPGLVWVLVGVAGMKKRIECVAMSLPVVIGVVLAGLGSAGVAVLLARIWRKGDQLDRFINDLTMTPKAQELAQVLVSILNTSFGLVACLALIGVGHILLEAGWSRASSQTSEVAAG